MSRVSRREAKILRDRSDEMRRKGGIPLAEIERRMRAAMVEELHRMARANNGTPARAKALLDAILVAEAEGLSPELFAKIRREAWHSLRKRAA